MEVGLNAKASTKVACHGAQAQIARMDIVGFVTEQNSLGEWRELHRKIRTWAYCILLGKNTSSHQVASSVGERTAGHIRYLRAKNFASPEMNSYHATHVYAR